MDKSIYHLTGFGNHFQTEAKKGALPLHQNSPQQAPLGLYPEQISGTAFTMARHQNRFSWLYRIRPSVQHAGRFESFDMPNWQSANHQVFFTPPTQLRLSPLTHFDQTTDFLDGIRTVTVNGSISAFDGGAVHQYAANSSMTRYFYNSDAEMLFIPSIGTLTLHTEFGILTVKPGSIAIVPRGVRLRIDVDGPVIGYLHENYGYPFILPDRGVIGANGLTEERHFIAPHAAYEDKTGPFDIITKFNGEFWVSQAKHSPLDVVAWHGNLTPFLYNLSDFSPVWAVNRDHSDPSIFTVLTSPSALAGTANIDFVIFPSRWLTVENTFRPPYFHRNVMSECMGLIEGIYDAKATGFEPGGISIHNCMAGHGPDSTVFEAASAQKLEPTYYNQTLAFMLESNKIWQYTDYANQQQQKDYVDCWSDLSRRFKD
ncbi:homogentisate 1,2-dioxygenase [Piscirickettsia salmonis]|nr:homogentisate 1,2-dioxygenase [Piscirickettsia salmonis]WGZ70932.1 homogentisate 1,2-dioxygenase [Piscirickettsia salmonis EM-90]APS45357.1 homogentisate 1,2-dioxygenase [Piscirickettsia salmonis]APS48717.1 homogentisate 1,2-dioxygenase [Piscirickettsia salmonis]APS53153.1 homogentisate 1,2-dioxygenase [Piscirickettsia salmonis]APS56008.1 homogentisate 1,2-dioxygenase [Piscirickettsia salmonis]